MWILIEKHCVFIVPLYLDVDTLIWRAHKTAAVQWSWTHAIFKFHMNRRHFVLLAFQIIWITEFSFLFTHFNIKITCIEWLLKFWTLNDLKNHPKKKPTKKSGCEIGIAFGEIRTVILNKCMCAFNRWANVCVILESPFFDFDAHKGVWIHFISSWVSNCECVVVFSYSNLVVPSFYCCCFFYHHYHRHRAL